MTAWPVAKDDSLLVLAPVMGFVLERLAKALAAATMAAKVVTTVGLLPITVGSSCD
jgi:hypothetical protein